MAKTKTEQVQQTLAAARAEIDRLNVEIYRLNEAKRIILGRCKVVIAIAHEEGSDIENEVLIIDAQGRKACIGEDCGEFANISMENADPRVLARFVVEHPDGAAILINQLEKAVDNIEAAEREKEHG